MIVPDSVGGGKSEHSSSQEEKKAVGNAHRFGGNAKQGKAAQRQYYPDLVGRKVKSIWRFWL